MTSSKKKLDWNDRLEWPRFLPLLGWFLIRGLIRNVAVRDVLHRTCGTRRVYKSWRYVPREDN